MSAAWSIEYLARQPALLPALTAWLYDESHGALGLTRRDVEALLQERARLSGWPLTFVAMSEGAAVGLVSLVEEEAPEHAGTLLCLAGLHVRAAWRGRGLGAALCRRAEAEARTAGCAHLHLFTEHAAAYYQRLGWPMLGEVVRETRTGFLLAAHLVRSLA